MGKRKKVSSSRRVPQTPVQSVKKSSKPRAPTVTPPSIPFDPSNRVLLVGEGDFSFAHSLLSHHGCTSLLATCLDTRPVLVEKYPQSEAHISGLLETQGDGDQDIKVLYGIDATKLRGKEVKRGGFDRIVFNFPHVGGLTKDVNRQVRYNQELLVGFFKSAAPLLADGGLIVLTVFEGEPYELWNVRDLARHVGLKVGRTFKFQAAAYPGYVHARTLGNIRGGGWKGEHRAARTYLFEVKDGEEVQTLRRKRKRGHNGDGDDDDDDD